MSAEPLAAPPRRNPRVIPLLMLLTGLGLAGYYGLAWYQLPKYSEKEIEQSAELNLALDLARIGAKQAPQGKELDQLRAQERREVEADLRRELRTVQQRFAAGLVAMVFGIGQLVFVIGMERARQERT